MGGGEGGRTEVTDDGPHLSDVLLLLLTQGQLDEDLLQLLVAIVDDELFKAVVLWAGGWGGGRGNNFQLRLHDQQSLNASFGSTTGSCRVHCTSQG